MGGAFSMPAWIGIWIAVAAVVNTTDYDGNEAVYWFEAFYRTGSIIFGGGQVVLPLLLKDVVQYDSTCQLANGTRAVERDATLRLLRRRHPRGLVDHRRAVLRGARHRAGDARSAV